MNGPGHSVLRWSLIAALLTSLSFAADATSFPKEPDAVLLARFKEPSIRLTRVTPAKQEVRFILLRAFSHPVAVRAYLKDDVPHIRVSRLSGTAGYELGTLAFENEYPLSLAHWRKIVELSSPKKARNPNDGITQQQLDAFEGTDGSTWILEVSDADCYSFAAVRNPDAVSTLKEEEIGVPIPDYGAFLKCCRYLLQFAPFDEGPDISSER